VKTFARYFDRITKGFPRYAVQLPLDKLKLPVMIKLIDDYDPSNVRCSRRETESFVQARSLRIIFQH